jgi:hypothetical protein
MLQRIPTQNSLPKPKGLRHRRVRGANRRVDALTAETGSSPFSIQPTRESSHAKHTTRTQEDMRADTCVSTDCHCQQKAIRYASRTDEMKKGIGKTPATLASPPSASGHPSALAPPGGSSRVMRVPRTPQWRPHPPRVTGETYCPGARSIIAAPAMIPGPQLPETTAALPPLHDPRVRPAALLLRR